METAYIVDIVRTPVGKFGGTLASVRPDDLAAHVIRALMARNPSFDSKFVEDVIFGAANQAGEDNRNVARMASLLAGYPHSVPGETINRLCASGMAATVHAARALHMEDANVMVSGGVEHMTRGPWVMSKASKAFGRDSQMHDSSFGWRFINPKLDALYGTDGMGTTAENLVDLYGISREDQDLFASRSQHKAAQAQEAGHFSEEIAPVNIPRRKQEDLELDARPAERYIAPELTGYAARRGADDAALCVRHIHASLCAARVSAHFCAHRSCCKRG